MITANYICRTEEDFKDLMQYLEDNGVLWNSNTKPTGWGVFDKDRVYCIEDNVMTYNDSYPKVPNVQEWVRGGSKQDLSDKSEQSLADFLGWEENVIYEKDEWIYKIEDGILKSKMKNEEMGWVHDTISINKYTELRNFKRHNPCYMIRTIFEDDNSLQYVTKNGPKVFLAPKSENKDLQIFTEDDAKDLIKKYNLQDIAALVKIS